MSKEFNLDTVLTDELKHHGIKGMKWGVRKDRDGGSSRRRSKRQAADEAKATRKRRNRTTSAERLSNEELQKRVKRLELEKKYNSLTTNKREGLLVETGGRVVKDLLYEISKDLAKEQVVSVIKGR